MTWTLWEYRQTKLVIEKICTYLTMLGLPIFAIRVGQMTVLIPPATMMSQCTVAEGNIIVSVKSRELPSIVVSESIP